MRTVIGVGLVVLLCRAAPASSSDEVSHQVAIPLLCGGVGLTVAEAPQIVWGSSWDSPGMEVLHTTAACYVETDLGLENRNAANRMRIKIRSVQQVTPIRPGEEWWQGLFGDTLRVILDLSQMPSYCPYPIGGPPDPVVEQTVDCMILNAVLDAQRPRYLDVTIEGAEGYGRLEGTYKLDDVPRPAAYGGPTSYWRTLKSPPNQPLQPSGAARRPG